MVGMVGMVVAVALGATSVSAGQSTPPACSAAVMGKPVFSAVDLDELQSSRLIATHTLRVTADLGDTLANDGVKFSLPSGATVVRPHGDVNAGQDGVIFVAHRTGPVAIAATWTQDDGTGGTCGGSGSTTLRVQAATRMPRLRNVRADEHLHPNLRWDLLWRFGVDLGRRVDLDPVTVMARGVSQPRLPGPHVRFRSVTVALRLGDQGLSHTGQHHISLPRWLVTTAGDESAFYVDGDEQGIPSPRDVPLGYEVKVIQSGRLIAHLRLAGVCNSTICNMRTIKVRLY